jgi:hypothetical protein
VTLTGVPRRRTLGRVRMVPLLFVAGACCFLLGCGSSGPPDTWSQTGSTLHASWTVPSASSVDLQLTRAVNATSCVTTSKGKSEAGTMLIVGGFPAAYFPIGDTLRAGSRVRTTCQVSGTVMGVSYGDVTFKHVKAR